VPEVRAIAARHYSRNKEVFIDAFGSLVGDSETAILNEQSLGLCWIKRTQPSCWQRWGNWRKIASLTMSAVSSTFRAHFSEHSEKSAISLSLMVLPFPTQARL